ncbi:putative G-protein coupled receptor [Schistosoma japonicum]|uniref:Putative G-protein coupled receptor n=1 Tax=Schistosoma japonicum TaxID=6182 RepID=A0A4Z2DRF2_SCHJA|nr:putative G-protein coupled receptor [Schistosoma japonicum]
MNIPQRLIVNLTRKSYLIDIITYSMIWCIFTTISNSNVIIKEEKLLRKFVNFVHSSQNDLNTACIINSRKLQHLLYTTNNNNNNNSISTTYYNNITSSTSLISIINLNDTFYPLFDNIINQKTLTSNFIHDIYRSIQIVQYFNRWYAYQQQLISSISIQLFRKQLEIYLLHMLHSIQLHNNIELLNNTLIKQQQQQQQLHNQYSMDTQSHLIGIGYCLNDLLMAYVNNYTTNNLMNSIKFNDICNQFAINKQLFNNNNNETIHFNDFQYGKFSTFWAPIQCDANSSIPIILRYFIYSVDKCLFFEYDLKDFVIDQCALNINRCGATTQCVYRKYHPSSFSMDNYLCECSPGYYADNLENGYPAPLIESRIHTALLNGESELPRFYCRSCPTGCSKCTSNKLCSVQIDYNLLRAIPLAFQTFCITICLLFGLAMFKLRRTRVVKSANLVLMEIMLIGAILLYSTIVVMYFPVSDITCLILPWFREVGFSIMYGVLIVKIYRVLSTFQSRKAHRVHVRDKDILKYLGMFIIITLTYMIAWTAINLDYISTSPWFHSMHSIQSIHQQSLITMKQEGYIKLRKSINYSHVNNSTTTTATTTTTTDLHESIVSNDSFNDEIVTFEVCRSMSWDVVVELAEFIILAISIHYCRLVRTAPCEYNETQYIGVALIIEMTVSGFLHLLRHFIWYSVHPDYMFLLYFARSHITITVNLLLIFVPKVTYLCRSSKALYNTTRPRGSPGTGDPHLATAGKLNLVSNGDLDIADVNLADMDPEVIRRELKRLYTQIELYKTKAMRKDNPHISKRRGGRKQRRFSLQPFHKRHHGQTTSSVSVNMMPNEAGCCCTECQSTKCTVRLCSHQCSRHLSSHKLSTNSSSGSSSGTNRGNYTTILHDEEISKLSEESTNSADDQSSVNNLLQTQHQQQQQQQQSQIPSQSNQQQSQIKLAKENDKTTAKNDNKRSKSKSNDKTR